MERCLFLEDHVWFILERMILGREGIKAQKHMVMLGQELRVVLLEWEMNMVLQKFRKGIC